MSALVPVGSTRLVVPGDVELVPRHGATLAEAVRPFLHWLGSARGRRALTVENYGRDLKSFLAFCTRRGLVYPDDVSHRDIEAYLATTQRERGVKAATACRHLSCLKALWLYMVRESVAVKNPASVSFGPRVPPRRIPKYIPKAEHGPLLEALAQDTSLMGRRDYAMTATLLLAGLRCMELAGLRCEDLDLTDGRLYVANGKGGRDRWVTVVPQLAEILRGYVRDVRPALGSRPMGRVFMPKDGRAWCMAFWQDGRRIERTTGTTDEAEARRVLLATAPQPPASPWVFVNAHPLNAYRLHRGGAPLLTRTIYGMIKRRVVPIIGRHAWPHLLRHSYATRLITNGAPLELIKEELGHARLDTTLVYAHIPSDKRHADVTRFLG